MNARTPPPTGHRPADHGASIATEANAHVRPYVHEANGKRALHFSIRAIESRLDLRHPDRLDIEYTRLMMAFLLLQPEPARIAMIGLGGGSLARFCVRQLPGTDVCVAEINPHVIALREQFLVPADSERFRVVRTDGASFVRAPPWRPDVLLVDGYDADGLPRSLSTQRFFDHCAQALLPCGVLVMNLYTQPARQIQVLERIRRSFGGVALPVFDSDRTNCVVFACHGHALEALRAGPLRRPRALDAEAWSPLQGAFARVLAARQEEFA